MAKEKTAAFGSASSTRPSTNWPAQSTKAKWSFSPEIAQRHLLTNGKKSFTLLKRNPISSGSTGTSVIQRFSVCASSVVVNFRSLERW